MGDVDHIVRIAGIIRIASSMNSSHLIYNALSVNMIIISFLTMEDGAHRNAQWAKHQSWLKTITTSIKMFTDALIAELYLEKLVKIVNVLTSNFHRDIIYNIRLKINI